MKARMINLTQGLDGEYQLTIGTRDKDVLTLWDDLHEGDIAAEIKRFRRRRSLDANAYAWVLIDKLAAALGRKKLEIYREAIRGIGGVSDTCCVTDRAVESLIHGWEHNGLGWFAETMPSKITGCTNVILYRGSSTYDSRQMSALIDSLIPDCEAVGIPTITPREIASMTAAWGGKHEASV